MRRIFFGLAFLLLSFSAADARDGAPLPVPEAPPRTQDAMDKVPDEYIAEAGAVYDECLASYTMSQYYNCECLSLAFLDARIENGPSVAASSLKQGLSHMCRDAVGAAGPVYQSCLDKANRFSPGTDPEKYCECVANTYVKDISRNAPFLDSRSMVSHEVLAYTACDNPDDRR
ncbi:MAG: hypothetical protein R3E13_08760 [Alphaproteobacteria bacterium]